MPIEYEVASLWYRSQAGKELNAEIEVEIVDPDNKKVKSFIHQLVIKEKVKRMRTRIKIQGFVISIPGEYYFNVKIKEKGSKVPTRVAHLPLEVVFKNK